MKLKSHHNIVLEFRHVVEMTWMNLFLIHKQSVIRHGNKDF